MTPEKQRIAIAEACGTMKWSYALPTRCIGASVPDYPNDRNAILDALGAFTNEQQILFIRHLVGSDKGFDAVHKIDPAQFPDREAYVEQHIHSLGWDEVWCYVLRADAAKFCEAFLKTIGKWEEDAK